MVREMQTTSKRNKARFKVVAAVACCVVLAVTLACVCAAGMRTPAYAEAGTYSAGEEETFADQDIDYAGTVDDSASTSYYVIWPEQTDVVEANVPTKGSTSDGSDGTGTTAATGLLKQTGDDNDATTALLLALMLASGLTLCLTARKRAEADR